MADLESSLFQLDQLDFFDQQQTMGTRWAPARAAIFQDWNKIPLHTGTGQF